MSLGAGGNKEVLRGNGNRLITTTRDGIRVRFQESTTYLISDPTGLVKGYELLGGLFTVTPWLGNLAKNYSKFRFNSVRVLYQSVCPTTQTGDVIIAWVPDVNDASSWSGNVNSTSIFNYPKWVSGPCYAGSTTGFGQNSMSVTVSRSEIHNSMPWFYVGQSGELLNHFAGAFIYQLGANGSGAGKSCGRVHVEYDIELCQPQSPLHLALKNPLSIDERGRQTHPDPDFPSSPKPGLDRPSCSS